MADSKRKTTLEIVNPKLDIVNWLLRSCTGDELEYLVTIAKATKFKTFVQIVDKFTQKNINDAFMYMAKNPQDLSDYRASKRGEVAALRALLIVCQQATEEIQRRKKKV